MWKKKHYHIVIPLFFIMPTFMLSVMGSTNYKIQSDSINIGGGLSTSTNYTSQDTVGEVGTGISTSTNFRLSAGYQQLTSNYIAITSPGSVTLPHISGLVGGTSTSSSAWTVTTDDPAGYSLSIQASTNPALKGPGGASISDYSPAGANPDFTFSISTSQSAFGFNPVSADVVQKYKNNGSACNTGSTNTSANCWDGFSTTQKTISQSSANNTPNGTLTTVNYQAQIGSAKIQDSGSYSATITVTALAL